jgi:addiction module HigA family antidote
MAGQRTGGSDVMTDAEEDVEIDVEHPGEVLHHDFLAPLGLSSNQLAMALRIPPPRITELVRGRRGMTPDTALRLARYFGTTAEFWMGLQASHDLYWAREDNGARIEAEIEPRQGDDKALRKRITKTVKKRAAVLKDMVKTP